MDNTNELGHIPINHADDFSLIDFVNEVDFEQFIDVFREENVDPIVDFCTNYDSEHIAGCFDDSQFVVPIQEDLFDFDVTDIEPNYALTTFSANMRVGEEENDGDQSSDTTRTNTTTRQAKKSTKADRPRTIISERRRRGRMKEKLYALRSLVPNITKMDKASIIGDAVLYVQDLQMQAKKLKTEIAGLESSLTETNRYQQGSSENVKEMNLTYNHPVIKKIMQIDVLQAEERGFYVRLVCNKGLGVTVSLYKALESLSSFNVQSSNLVTAAEDYVLTFTINVRECKLDMDLLNLKFWIASAFLNEGFDFETTLSA